MPATVIERHYRDRVESLRLIALANGGDGPRRWQFYEDVANLCFELSVSGRELLEQEYKRVFKEPNPSVSWLRERRQAIEALTGNYVKLAEAVRDAALAAGRPAGLPHVSALAVRIDEAIRAMVAVRQSVLDRWPVGSDEETATAAAAAARGEGLDIDEAFAQIAGVDVATWRQRIEDRSAHPQP